MHPQQPGQTETALASLTELFMNIAFLPTKPAKLRIKAKPGTLQTTEYAQTLHGDIERLTIGVLPSGIIAPRAPHLCSPLWLEMGSDSFLIIQEQRTLQQIMASRMLAVELFESGNGPRRK